MGSLQCSAVVTAKGLLRSIKRKDSGEAVVRTSDQMRNKRPVAIKEHVRFSSRTSVYSIDSIYREEARYSMRPSEWVTHSEADGSRAPDWCADGTGSACSRNPVRMQR